MTPSKSLFFYLCYFGIIGIVLAQIAAKPAPPLKPVEHFAPNLMKLAEPLRTV